MELSNKQLQHIHDKSRKLMITGSAGSGKTLYGSHKCILYALMYAGARCYVFRQTLNALRITIYREIIELLDNYQIPYDHNKAEFKLTLFNGSTIEFKGLDDKRKIRSINADFIIIEQAEEINEPVYRELEKRLRGKVSDKYYGQMLLIVQPESQSHFLYKIYYKNRELEETNVIHFCYKDNPYLPPAYVREYKLMKEIDYEYYLNYSRGEWIEPAGAVYTNYDDELSDKGYSYYTAGVDFGFNNPSCFLLTGWLDGEPYVIDEVYERKLTNAEFIQHIEKCLDKNELSAKDLDVVYCDSAEPDRIEEFCQAGFNAIGADKSVSAGIDSVRRVIVHIATICEKTWKEIGSYKYRKDKDGNILEEPVKINDHAMDALRYCVYGELGVLNQELHKEPDYDYINRLNEW